MQKYSNVYARDFLRKNLCNFNAKCELNKDPLFYYFLFEKFKTFYYKVYTKYFLKKLFCKMQKELRNCIFNNLIMLAMLKKIYRFTTNIKLRSLFKKFEIKMSCKVASKIKTWQTIFKAKFFKLQ